MFCCTQALGNWCSALRRLAKAFTVGVLPKALPNTTLVFVLAFCDGVFLTAFLLFGFVAGWLYAIVGAYASSKKTLKQAAELRKTRVRKTVMGFECSQAYGHALVLS